MPTSSPALVALLLFCSAGVAVPPALAQTHQRVSLNASLPAPVGSGRIDGYVRDQTGRPVEAVSIVAMGQTVAAARTDVRGRFSLVIEPGEYVLRVSRAGYLSTYREAVRVRSSVRLEREITLVRVGDENTTEVLLAGMAEPGATEGTAQPTPGRPGTHSHTEAAWRLRHLPRSVLRDGNALLFEPEEAETFTRRGSVVNLAAAPSASLAQSLFRGRDFTGQLNFLTTSVLDSSVGWVPDTWPRSIAYFEIGSVAGSHGDWEMRGSIGGGDTRSWAVTGEYQSPIDADHAVRFGVSYSTQGYIPQRSDRFAPAAPAARSVAGVYAFNQWMHGPIEIDFGARFDRYDYITTPELLSPRAAGRVALPARLFAVGAVSYRMIAPGADEFLPPASPGPWLPPERTFSSWTGGPLRAAQVRHADIGLGRQFGRGERTAYVVVRQSRQWTRDQIATLFGLDSASDLGHYYVVSPGDVEMRAWTVEGGLQLATRLEARVEYSAAGANWDRHPFTWLLRKSAPSVIRPQSERLHDVTTVFNAHVPETSTRVTFAYRINSGFSAGRAGLPVAGGRFDLNVRQALPYQPIRGARLELLVAARTMSREPSEGASFFDELLTVAPPLRLMGGVQVRF